MNSSFYEETNKSNELPNNNTTKLNQIASKDVNKSSNIINSLKRYKKYYKKKNPKREI